MTRVLITRSAVDAPALEKRVYALGAESVCVPLIARRSLASALSPPNEKKDWLFLTSRWTVEAIREAGVSPQSFANKIAVVGPATLRAAEMIGAPVHYAASKHTALQLIEELPLNSGDSVFFPRGNLAPSHAIERLNRLNVHVDAPIVYENVLPVGAYDALDDASPFDIALVCSASAGKRLAKWSSFRESARAFRVIALGPSTASACEEAGLVVHNIADPHTIDGLIIALEDGLNRWTF